MVPYGLRNGTENNGKRLMRPHREGSPATGNDRGMPECHGAPADGMSTWLAKNASQYLRNQNGEDGDMGHGA
jgi:hypothetical protein